MRSFPALMILILVDCAIYALIIRPAIGGVAEIAQAVAMMLNTSFPSFR
ncbi:hypothetical protein HRbin27_01488 [bacterium HR27]|nr:hypothetical protein HRbin27_01488 [bacterium HR27]